MRYAVLLASCLAVLHSVSAAQDGERSLPPNMRLVTEVVAEGFHRPLFLTTPPGEPTRMFVLEQQSGQIWIIDGGEVLPAPFLNVGANLSTSGNEQGLLGMAFHPDFTENGLFFVSYTDTSGASVIERYQVSDNPDVADPASAFTVFGPLPQPFANHNGGMITFGPDGYLYLGMGDGGSAGDPMMHAQNLDVMYGKLLRMDVNGDGPAQPVPSNPFFERGGDARFVWAYGLRNPWRFTFDRLTGDMYIGDVGQGAVEEISFQPASSAGGENYGWNVLEGSHDYACNDPLTDQDCADIRTTSVYPIHEYLHDPRPPGRSVTGGYVYRGTAMPGLEGTYFFADYRISQVWSFRYDGTEVTGFQELTESLTPLGGEPLQFVSSFGEDGNGELYILDFQQFAEPRGRVLRLKTVHIADLNQDDVLNAVDVQLVINGVLEIDISPYDPDVNGDGAANAVDIQTVINAVLGIH